MPQSGAEVNTWCNSGGYDFRYQVDTGKRETVVDPIPEFTLTAAPMSDGASAGNL